jgi:hypothetical protein
MDNLRTAPDNNDKHQPKAKGKIKRTVQVGKISKKLKPTKRHTNKK